MRILYEKHLEPHILNTKLGELVYNKFDHILYTKDKYQNILKISSGSGGGKDGKDGKDGRDGVSFNIQGTDTYANIINIPNPKKGDMWIASDRDGHGIVYSGIKWNDVGKIVGPKGDAGIQGQTGSQGKTGTAGKSAYAVWIGQGNTGSVQDFFMSLQGPKGVQGSKGPRGTGIHFLNVYATKADMIAANPNPAIGDVHLVNDTGDLWVWDNPTPPHDPANAIWSDVGHVRGPVGPAGVQGIQGVPGNDGQPGVDGKDGDPLQLATTQETIDGTVSDKANTPEGTRAAYVPNTGGSYSGTITVDNATTGSGLVLSASSSTGAFLRNSASTSTLQFQKNGIVKFSIAPGLKLMYGTSEVATVAYVGVQLAKYVPLAGKVTTTGNLTIGESGSSASVKLGGDSSLGSYALGNAGNIIRFMHSGRIELTPAKGQRVTVGGKNVLTGKLTGTTLHLDF